MLWYKSWLETRLRLVIALGYLGTLLLFLALRGTVPPGLWPMAAKPSVGLPLMVGSFVTVMCTLFAGSGIASQGSFQFLKGLHGSTQFTLSLPVTRLRLMAVRVALGWAEMTVVFAVLCLGVWVMAPYMRNGATPVEMIEYCTTLAVCAAAPYSLSVGLATFLDDQWRAWATMIACAAMWGMPYLTPVPAVVDIYRAFGVGSPLSAHIVPWPTMAFSMASAGVLFLAAFKIAKVREY